MFDIGHVGVWCEAFTVDFGHVQLPPARVANVPPSLHMLGVSPQVRLTSSHFYIMTAKHVMVMYVGKFIFTLDEQLYKFG